MLYLFWVQSDDKLDESNHLGFIYSFWAVKIESVEQVDKCILIKSFFGTDIVKTLNHKLTSLIDVQGATVICVIIGPDLVDNHGDGLIS